MLDYRLDAVPLFVAGQAALAEDNQTRVHLDVEKPDKIALPVTTAQLFSKA